MAVKRPLIRYADTGGIEELRASDTLAGAGSGSTASQITLNVASVAKSGYAEVVVADAGVSATSKLFASFVAELDAENDAEQLIDDRMQVYAVPEAGQIRFIVAAVDAFVGEFKVNYQVFA